MFMDTTETGRLCKNVEYAAAQVRTSIGEHADISDILDRFWFLQDTLSRLLEAVDNEDGDVTQCRGLIRKVVEVLGSPQVRKLSSIPAVKLACETINSCLISLEQTTQPPRTTLATSKNFGSLN
jgi:hypothetical protein